MSDKSQKPSTARSAASLLLVSCLALVGAGCAGQRAAETRPSPAPEIPTAWRQASAAAGEKKSVEIAGEEIAAWWRELGDPTLDRLVEAALEGNIDIQIAAARVAESRARRGLSKADLGPSVTAGFDGRASESLGSSFSSESYGVSLTASWEADLFGAKKSALEASEAELAASSWQLHGARVALIAEVVVAYADLRSAEARLWVIEESLESRGQTHELVDYRERAGLASRLEVDQALTSREQTRASLATFERARVNAELRLALLAGRAPGAFETLLIEGQGLVPAPPEGLTIDLPAEALRRRPDVQTASYRFESALARLDVAGAARYPTLRLTGSIDGQSSDLEDLLDADSLLANLIAGLTAPIFESGRIEQNVSIEQARVEQQALAYRDQILVALSEVESALASLRLVGGQIEALDGAMAAAREAAELADQRYASGLVDLLVVLDSQRTLLNLQEQLVAAQGERVVAFSNLYRALGGGWQTADSHSQAPGERDA